MQKKVLERKPCNTVVLELLKINMVATPPLFYFISYYIYFLNYFLSRAMSTIFVSTFLTLNYCAVLAMDRPEEETW